ncbi:MULTISPECIES: GntR family transcriptional regulator [Bacillaceae]|uniref:GntR family transcriptional regulator n=1 Tax=Evansella alkalicola TaxID=745819 RepID=A0ABS6JYP0_9BACI|nr:MULTISPECIES: GntR family transcriptional regulator [Bacillaceae]MBU9723713.1 GntR family transcriptional regulator [Bacillus alkalicola]
MAIQFDQNRPIYIQLMEFFYRKICRSELKVGEKLPSVRETAIQVEVNPNTVSRAYMEMEREKVVVTKRGQGTFVTEDNEVIKDLREKIAENQVDAFLVGMVQIGFTEEDIISIIQKRMPNIKGRNQDD